MNPIQTLASVLGLSFSSGVNLYASILVVGLGARLGWLHNLPGNLEVLGHPLILGTAAVMYFLEFFADKIPYVSVAWDTIHTVIRPLGGAALALTSVSNLSPEVQALAVLAGGSIALASHSTKMSYRLIAHASPEPVSDSVFSLAEDAGVAGFVFLIYKYPVAALCVAVVLLASVALILPKLLRMLAFAYHGLIGVVVSWFPGPRAACTPPGWLLSDLPAAYSKSTLQVIRCYVRKVPQAPWIKEGFLLLDPVLPPRFAYRGWFSSRLVTLSPGELNRTRGIIFDQLCAPAWSVYVTKDCTAELSWTRTGVVQPAPGAQEAAASAALTQTSRRAS